MNSFLYFELTVCWSDSMGIGQDTPGLDGLVANGDATAWAGAAV
jgi:hypothetical protein